MHALRRLMAYRFEMSR